VGIFDDIMHRAFSYWRLFNPVTRKKPFAYCVADGFPSIEVHGRFKCEETALRASSSNISVASRTVAKRSARSFQLEAERIED
jgi:hypothetical protein